MTPQGTGRKSGPHQAVKHEPQFDSAPAKTAMDAIRALLWIPDAVAKILLFVAVVALGWLGWQEHKRDVASEAALNTRIYALELQAIRTAEQRSSEMTLIQGAIDEIKEYRRERMRGGPR